MKLHHQAILQTHAGIFHQHMPGKTGGILSSRLAFEGALKNYFGLLGR
jgi:hypothetical protein